MKEKLLQLYTTLLMITVQGENALPYAEALKLTQMLLMEVKEGDKDVNGMN